MALFGFGAFSTPVGQLIGEFVLSFLFLRDWSLFLFVERATDNAASAGNIALHLQICDVVNGTENGLVGHGTHNLWLFTFHICRAKEAVAAIRKRLTGSTKNFHIINLTLTVSWL